MTIFGHCFRQLHNNLPQNLGSEGYFGQKSLWAVYCRRNCFESVKIWRSRLGSSNFLIKTWFLSLLVCLFLLLNCSSWVADILMKSWIEKHYQGVNIKVWKDMRMNNILEKNFFCPWLIVTLVKEVFEQFTVGGTALRLSKFDAVDLVPAILWSRFLIIFFSDQDMILVPIVMFVFAIKLFKLGWRYSNEVVDREVLSRSQHQSLKRHENE